MKPKKSPSSKKKSADAARPAHETTKKISTKGSTPETGSPAKAPEKSPAKSRLQVPPILFEGDKPEKVSASGPGQRYALGPTPPAERLDTEGELPEAYGTQRLLLTARDPHWLYAH